MLEEDYEALSGLHLAFDLALLEEINEAFIGLHIEVDYVVDFGLHSAFDMVMFWDWHVGCEV